MKKWLLTIAALGAAAVLTFWLFQARPTPADRLDEAMSQAAPKADATPARPAVALSQAPTPASPGSPISPQAPPAPAAARVSARTAPAQALAPVPAPNAEAPNTLPPATLLENMRTTVRQYGLMFGGNPVGTNPEITQALNGDNLKHVTFLGPDGNRINQKGELVDSWGTPYFFHQLSAMEMEIRSAGPDQIMWSADDLVIK